MKHAQRQLIRLAQAICEANRPRREPIRTRWPVECCEKAQRLHRRIEHARRRGWNAAARRLTEELQDAIQDLQRLLNVCHDGFEDEQGTSLFANSREIYADLAALSSEFPSVEWDYGEKTLTAVTEPVVFDDVWLGPFAIELHWDSVYATRYGCYRVIAQDPHPSSLDEETTHPHIQGDVLCEGQAAAAIRRALSQGRLLDFFLLVRSVLGTYNASSAYVMIENWDGVRCEECDCTADSSEVSECAKCDRRLCDECCASCPSCYKVCCYQCRADCALCEETFCVDCLEACSGCARQVCPSCRDANQKCENCHEASESESSGAGAAVQPDRLGQAAVSA